MKYLFLIIFFLGTLLSGNAQECTLSIHGRIIDEATQEGLAYANIYIEEQEVGTVSDEDGGFHLHNLCPGDLHIRVSHVGCSGQRLFFNFRQDTILDVIMDHHDQVLHQVDVIGSTSDIGISQVRGKISSEDLDLAGSQSVASLAARIPGVSTIKTGGGIDKPVIHGLYGNRIAIIQNGLNLTSQRWGNDHAPEVASVGWKRVSIIKGTDALEYGGEGLGGAMVLEANPAPGDPHIHGKTNYSFQSNGRGHFISTQWRQARDQWGWEAFGSGQWNGDYRTPEYYLTNTGQRGYSAGVRLYFSGATAQHELSYSFYQMESGVLRGGHIGNTSDLEAAFDREEPFFTEEEFSYDINAPRQTTQHHTFSLKSTRVINPDWTLKGQYGFQWNDREEFDVRRGGRSSTPSLSMDLFSHQGKIDAIYKNNDWSWKTGIQGFFSNNQNNSETGVYPLIPDYISTQAGLYSTLKYAHQNLLFEGGVRYDFRYNSVVQFIRGSSEEFNRYRNRFHNITASLGLLHNTNDHFNWGINFGVTQRQPGINELYSDGLHQGVAGIEEGDANLSGETGLKSTLRARWHIHDLLWVEGAVYAQYIDEYIFLKPEDEFRLTIRGAFPVFSYSQTNAYLSGADISLNFQLLEPLNLIANGSLIRGWDAEREEPLIYIPQDQIGLELNYSFGQKGDLSVEGNYVFEQKRFPEDQDFLPPPPGYFLLSAKGKFQWSTKGLKWTAYMEASNILDQSYRNYLNRWRYFADDLGFNLRMGVILDL